MVNFMIFVIFLYVLHRIGILETLVSLIFTGILLFIIYLFVLGPLFEKYENLKFYIFVFISVIMGIKYIGREINQIILNFSKDKEDQDLN